MGSGNTTSDNTRSDATADQNDQRADLFEQAENEQAERDAGAADDELPDFEDFEVDERNDPTDADRDMGSDGDGGGDDAAEDERPDLTGEPEAPLGRGGAIADTRRPRQPPPKDGDTSEEGDVALAGEGNGPVVPGGIEETAPVDAAGENDEPGIDTSNVPPAAERPENPWTGEPQSREAHMVMEEVTQATAGTSPDEFESLTEQAAWFGERVGSMAGMMLADGFEPRDVAVGVEAAARRDETPFDPSDLSHRGFTEALFNNLPAAERPEFDHALTFHRSNGRGFGDEVREAFGEQFETDHPELAEALVEEFGYDRDGTTMASVVVKEAHQEQIGKMYGEKMAPYFQVATEITGNDSVPEARMGRDSPFGTPENPYECEVSQAKMQVAREKVGQTQALLRDTFGDTLTVYRGYKGDERVDVTAQPAGATTIGSELREAAEEGEGVRLHHRAIETWTLNPGVAASYGSSGAVIHKEVPVEQVLGSGMTGGQLPTNELILAHERTETYHPEQIMLGDDRPDVLTTAGPAWHESVEQAHLMVQAVEELGGRPVGTEGSTSATPIAAAAVGGTTVAAIQRAERTTVSDAIVEGTTDATILAGEATLREIEDEGVDDDGTGGG